MELRGSTTPAWITVLLLFTVMGFLLASVMTSRSYRVTVPLDHAVHDRWKRNRRLAWAAGLLGLGAVVWASSSEGGAARWRSGPGSPVVVAAVVGGTVNATRSAVGFYTTRHDYLVLTRVHGDFARAAAAATVETVPGARGTGGPDVGGVRSV